MLEIVIVFGVLLWGAYFVLFQKPELIEIVAPAKLQGISSVSKLSFDPSGVIDSPTFKSLREYAGEVPRTQVEGKENPFEPF